MLSSVPSQAADEAPTAITVGTIPTAQVGVSHITPVTVAFPAGGTTDSFTVNVRVTSSPVGSAYRSLNTSPTLFAGAAASGNTVKAQLSVTIPSSNKGTLATSTADADSMTVGSLYVQGAAAAVAGTASFNMNVMPDVAGTYTVLVSTNGTSDDNTDPYAAGDASVSYTFSTSAAVSTVTLAAVTGSGYLGTSNYMIMKATLKDATGAVAQLGANETLRVYASSATGTVDIEAYTTPTTAATVTTTTGVEITLDSSHFSNGVAYLRYSNSAAETAVITAVGAGLLATTVTSTLSLTTRAATTATVATAVFTDSTAQAAAIALGTSGHKALVATSATVYASTSSKAATSHAYKVTFGTGATTAGDYVNVTVTDTSGKITGIVGAVYNLGTATSASATTVTAGDTAAVSVTATLSTTANSFSVAVGGSTLTVSSAAQLATTTAASSPTVTTLSQAVAGSTAMTVRVTDQFGVGMASEVVTVGTTGRNVSTADTTLITDASGYATYTRADAGTAATVNKQDVVTFTHAVAGAKAYTINYGTAAVSTITCLTGVEDDTATSVTYTDISSGNGAQSGNHTLCTVTVKDVNGAILVGVPVTTTTTSAGAAVLSTTATLYSSASGTVVPKVYAWTNGTKTFTITAGGVTSTETVNYQQDDAAEVRSISVVADGNRHLVTAKDRFGNPVPGVRIYGTRTGNGLFGGGSPTANAITSAPTVVDSTTGVAEFIFNGGSATSVVKYQVASASDTPDATYGYTAAIKGSQDDGTTAITAYVAGTALVAEVGVGSSFDAAGVNSVTATIAADTAAIDTAQAAVDAAAEATDAANAATDAANAAAEAADAATAAAQDAADAVAALSAQVATLISGLKAQLTALTNLVIKIQKKVKA
jgi:hypothetical protein